MNTLLYRSVSPAFHPRSSVVGSLGGVLQALRMRQRKIPSSLFALTLVHLADRLEKDSDFDTNKHSTGREHRRRLSPAYGPCAVVRFPPTMRRPARLLCSSRSVLRTFPGAGSHIDSEHEIYSDGVTHLLAAQATVELRQTSPSERSRVDTVCLCHSSPSAPTWHRSGGEQHARADFWKD
jgi:hypothetical protein